MVVSHDRKPLSRSVTSVVEVDRRRTQRGSDGRELTAGPGRRYPTAYRHAVFAAASYLPSTVGVMDTESVQPAVTGIVEMSSGRLAALVAYAAGTAGVVLGGLARRAARRTRPDGDLRDVRVRGRSTGAMALGLVSLVIGGVVVATADGGVGTGNGFAGGVLAIVLGLAALMLGGLARARTREVA